MRSILALQDCFPGIQTSHEPPAAVDPAVLTVYGWTDLLPKCTCEFLLDYEEGDCTSPVPRPYSRNPSRRKKPWLYHWPGEVAAATALAKAKRSGKKSTAPPQGELIDPAPLDLFR